MDERMVVGLGLTPEGRRVRTEVFIDEQGFAYEYDDIDQTALHLVCFINNEPAGAGRTFPDSENSQTWRIGRVAVRKPFRGTGLGRRVMETLEQAARDRGAAEIILLAQLQAQPFYAKLGYSPFGEMVYEEGCPHQAMRKELHTS